MRLTARPSQLVSDILPRRGHSWRFAPVARNYADVVLATANLVNYWKLDEATGTPKDSKGSADLTINGTVTQGVYDPTALDPSQTCYDVLNGAGMLTRTFASALSGAWSVECLCYPAAITNSMNRSMFGNNNGSRWTAQAIYDPTGSSANTRWHGDIGTGSAWAVTPTGTDKLGPQPNTCWFHFVLTVNQTSWVQYVNGVVNSSGTYSSTTPVLWQTNGVFGIFGRVTSDPAGSKWNGRMQHVAVYNTKISADTVTDHWLTLSERKRSIVWAP